MLAKLTVVIILQYIYKYLDIILYVNSSIILEEKRSCYVSIKLAFFMTWLIKEAIFTNAKSDGLRKKWYLFNVAVLSYELIHQSLFYVITLNFIKDLVSLLRLLTTYRMFLIDNMTSYLYFLDSYCWESDCCWHLITLYFAFN